MTDDHSGVECAGDSFGLGRDVEQVLRWHQLYRFYRWDLF